MPVATWLTYVTTVWNTRLEWPLAATVCLVRDFFPRQNISPPSLWHNSPPNHVVFPVRTNLTPHNQSLELLLWPKHWAFGEYSRPNDASFSITLSTKRKDTTHMADKNNVIIYELSRPYFSTMGPPTRWLTHKSKYQQHIDHLVRRQITTFPTSF